MWVGKKLNKKDLLSTNLATKKGYYTQRLQLCTGWDLELQTYQNTQNEKEGRKLE